MKAIIKKIIKVKNIFKVLLGLLCGYLIIALILSTFPYAKQADVSETSAKQFASSESYTTKTEAKDFVRLIEEPAETFNIRHELIKTAQDSIDLSYYIFHDGKSTDALMGDLLSAADRGVKIRLTIDGKIKMMDPKVSRKLRQLATHANIDVHYYNPAKLWNPSNWQAMLHDKYLIIDDAYALVGGNNIGDKYFEPTDYKGRITEDRDVLIINQNQSQASVIHDLKKYADDFWELKYNETIKGASDNDELLQDLKQHSLQYSKQQPHLYKYSLQYFLDDAVAANKVSLIHNPTHNGPKEPWAAHQLANLAKTAENQVLIQTPYSTSNNSILDFYQELKENDIEVKLLTNSMASTPNVLAFSTYYKARPKYLKQGVKIYEYQSKVDSLHAKTILIDDHLTAIGTFNLDDRSIYVSTEMMIVVDSEEFSNQVKTQMDKIKDHSLKVNEDGSYQKSNVSPERVSLAKKGLINIISIFTRIFEFVI